MAWYYMLNGSSQGPVEEAELRQLHQQNVVTLDTPVWTEGMPEWLPLQASSLSPTGTASGQSRTIHACAECGKSFAEDEMLQYENSWVCATCKPVFFQRIKEGVTLRGNYEYANVGKRFAAVFIDGIIIMILVIVPIIVATAYMKTDKGAEAPGWFTALMLVLQYGLPAAFEIFFIGKYGATPGKMLMKIKVVTPEGGPVSYGRATGRHFAKLLSGVILYVGYLMAFWDEEKRSLHDRICKTRVIINPST